MAHKPATKCSVSGPLTSSDSVALRAAAVVTTSFTATGYDDAIALGWAAAVFHIDIASGDATTFEFKAQGSADGGTTWRDLVFKGTPAAGLAAIASDLMQYTPAAASTAYNISLPPCEVTGFALVRLLAKYTGGTGTGTIAIGCSMGLVPVAA